MSNSDYALRAFTEIERRKKVVTPDEMDDPVVTWRTCRMSIHMTTGAVWITDKVKLMDGYALFHPLIHMGLKEEPDISREIMAMFDQIVLIEVEWFDGASEG